MILRYVNLLFLYFLLAGSVFSQSVFKGEVRENTTKQPIVGAVISVSVLQIGTATKENGIFELSLPAHTNFPLEVQFSCLGYKTKNILIPSADMLQNTNFSKIYLFVESTLNEVVITGTMKETLLSESPVKVELISKEFLRTTPTNNVMEAIQTVNGVQQQINCGVCGTNDIHINGMEGPYTLVLIDGMPIVSALASVYGFNGIPTSLIERIEIIKGPSSTLYGSEAVGGVVNIITQKPDKMPTFGLNYFSTTHKEHNIDASYRLKREKFSSVLSVNAYSNQNKIDDNNDNFTDIPLSNRLSVFNKWEFRRKNNWTASLAGRFYTEDRFGGQLQWNAGFRGSDKVYGESIRTNRIEIIGSYQLPLSKENIRIDFSFNTHKQDSFYGATPYNAKQTVFFSNFIWNKNINPNNSLLVGLTFRRNFYDDNTPATVSENINYIPGVFVQDEINTTILKRKTTFLFGSRLDYQNEHGVVVSPRMSLKYDFSETTMLRWNVGTGFRTVNLFTEDHAALTGARKVVIAEKLKPESSYNTTLNLNHTFELFGSIATIDTDFFYTYYNNRILPDYETNTNEIIYKNLAGYSIGRGFAVNYDQVFSFPLKVRMGITYQDVFKIETNASGESIKSPQLFSPYWSGIFVASYKFRRPKVSIDWTGKIMGEQFLPTYPAPFQRPEKSEWFDIYNIQITKEIQFGSLKESNLAQIGQTKNNFQIYAAVKNLLNQTQDSPLIDAQNPFGQNFDTAYAWGNLQTRRFLLGIRFNIL